MVLHLDARVVDGIRQINVIAIGFCSALDKEICGFADFYILESSTCTENHNTFASDESKSCSEGSLCHFHLQS